MRLIGIHIDQKIFILLFVNHLKMNGILSVEALLIQFKNRMLWTALTKRWMDFIR